MHNSRCTEESDVSLQNVFLQEASAAAFDLEIFFNLSPDLLGIINAEGYFQKLNPAWSSVLGFSLPELMAKPWVEFVHPEDRLETLAALRQIHFKEHSESHFLTQESHKNDFITSLENRHQHQDGGWRWLSWRLYHTPQGLIYATAREMTTSQTSAAFLSHPEPHHQILTAILPVGIFYTDPQGNCLYVNQRWRDIAGLTLAEALGSGWVNAIYPEDRERVFAEWYQAALAKRPFQSEYRFCRPDGIITWVLGQSIAEIGDQGKIKGYVGTITDISERKFSEQELQKIKNQLEALIEARTQHLQHTIEQLQLEIAYRQQIETALQQSEARFQRLAENLPGVIYQYRQDANHHHAFLYMSPGCRDLYEIEPDVILQNPHLMWEVIHPEDLIPFQQAERESAKTGQLFHLEWRITTPSGQLKWIQGISKPQRHLDGGIIWDGLLFDITERKALEAQLVLRQNRFDAFFANAPAGLVIWDDKLRYVQLNEVIVEMTGIGAAAQIGKPIREVVPDLAPLLEPMLQEILRTGKPVLNLEVSGETPKQPGFKRYWLASYFPLLGENGQATDVGAVVFEITERKRVESELQKTQRFLDLVLQTLPVAVFVKDAQELRFVLWNPTATKLLGFTPEEAIGKNDYDFFPKEQADFFVSKDREVLASGRILDIPEEAIITKTGETRILHTQKTAILDADGTAAYLLAIAEDITERKQAEEKLQEQEQFLRGIWEGVEYSIFVLEVLPEGEFRFLGMNPASQKNAQMPQPSIIGKTLAEVMPPAMAAIWRQRYHSCVQAGTTIAFEECYSGDGVENWWLTSLTPLRNPNADMNSPWEINRIVVTASDITSRKRAEAALQKSEEQYRALAQNFPDGAVFLFDLDLRYILADGTDLAALGLSKASTEGKTIWEIFPPDDCQAMALKMQDALAGITTSFESCYQSNIYYTQILPVKNEQGEIVSGMIISQNITERKQAEEALRQSEAQLRKQAQDIQAALHELQRTQAQLIQSEKMSSLGQLVAGVAHEINNPVSFIFGNLTFVHEYTHGLLQLIHLYQKHYPHPNFEIEQQMEEMDLGFLVEDLPNLLASMKLGAERIRDIVLSLRNFSRLDEAAMKRVNIHEGIDNALLILQNRLKTKGNLPEIQVIKDYGNLPRVECYAGQINQVFMNILSNAIDALEQGVREGIHAALTTPPLQPIIRIATEVIKGRCVVRIADNGIGMSPEIQQRLFDPFFTTKPVGQGTGLGLSISYQIVEKHKGTLRCESMLGKGTEFILDIPIQQV